ncbi:MAG: hypothetical protein AB7O82_35445 [Reyranella sp.]
MADAHREVGAVGAGGAYAHQHLAGTRLGPCHVLHLDALAARPIDDYRRAHAVLLL